MARAKNPPAVKRNGRIFCPAPGCVWSCRNRNSYPRHYDADHRPSFKFVCECTAGQDRRDMVVSHGKSCKKTREANDKRCGRKPRYATPRQARAAHPADPEEAVQELEELLAEKERQNQQLMVEKNQMQEEKDQMEAEKGQMEVERDQLKVERDQLMVEKIHMEQQKAQMEAEKDQMEVEKNQIGVEKKQLQVKLNAVVREKEELKTKLKEREEQEYAMNVGLATEVEYATVMEHTTDVEYATDVEHVMDIEHSMEVEPELDEQWEKEANDFTLSLSDSEVEEVVADELEEDEEGMEGEGAVQPPALISTPALSILPAPTSPPILLLRRSERKSRETLLREEQEALEAKLLVADDAKHGLVVVDIEGKGRGVKATRPIFSGEFVAEYTGELVDAGTGHAKEATYSLDMTKGSYSYYFTHKSTKYCLDATEESARFGRLLNHSRKHPTCVPKVVEVDGTPRVIFLANHNIQVGQEVTFDYGDRSKESLAACPWLAN